MRIIGGKHRGRNILPPKGLPVRPTTDQAKEGLFNILMHRYSIAGARVLELFAGTGNVSLEFWSRGAAELTAVDEHPACTRFVQSCFKDLGVHGQVLNQSAERFIEQATGVWDMAFMDPPYAWPGVSSLLETMFLRGLIAPGGLIIVEHSSGTQYSSLKYFLESRKYGSSSFSFFQIPDA